jgi:hypothetical protein
MSDIDDEIDELLEVYWLWATSSTIKQPRQYATLKATQAIKQLITDVLSPIQKEAEYEADRADRKELHSNVDGVLAMLDQAIKELKENK